MRLRSTTSTPIFCPPSVCSSSLQCFSLRSTTPYTHCSHVRTICCDARVHLLWITTHLDAVCCWISPHPCKVAGDVEAQRHIRISIIWTSWLKLYRTFEIIAHSSSRTAWMTAPKPCDSRHALLFEGYKHPKPTLHFTRTLVMAPLFGLFMLFRIQCCHASATISDDAVPSA